ncbi:MAG: DUF3796 domain-containing protein [Promethearchaeota archaeon]
MYYLGFLGFLGFLGLLYLLTGSVAWFGFFGFFGFFSFFRFEGRGDERLVNNFVKASRNGFIAVMFLITLMGAVIAIAWLAIGGPPVQELFFAALVLIMVVGYTMWGASMMYYDKRGD